MLDFYTVCYSLVGIAGLFGFISWRTDRQVNGIKTPITQTKPKPKPVPKPDTSFPPRFQLTDIDRVINTKNERKRNVGGRSMITEADLRSFDKEGTKLTFKWSHTIRQDGPGEVVVNGGGTSISKFLDIKFTRNSINIADMAFGSIQCDVMRDGKLIAIGRGKVKMGIISSGMLL